MRPVNSAAGGSIRDAIVARCQEAPSASAITFVSGDAHVTLTRAELTSTIHRTGAALVACGVRPGDVILLVSDDGLDLTTAFLGAIDAGAVPCIFPTLTPKLDASTYTRRLTAALSRLEPAAVIVQDDAGGPLGDASARWRIVSFDALATGAQPCPSDPSPSPAPGPAFIQMSSGSTGLQRAVVVPHSAVLNLVAARNTALAVGPGDVAVNWVPLYHDLGIVAGVLGPLVSGIPTVLIAPFAWLKRPVALMECVHRYRGTLSSMPNFGFGYCVKRIADQDMEGLDLSSWRVLSNAGEPVRPESFSTFATRFARWGFPGDAFGVAYGLAENTLTASMTPAGAVPRTDWIDPIALRRERLATPLEEHAGAAPVVSCGVPLPNVEVHIRDDSGRPVPDRSVGNVSIRSNCLFSGYYRNDADTQCVLKDGWLDTGDLGYWADGELFICGRRKDVIIVAGNNLFAEDIEAALSSVHGIRHGRLAVFGMPAPSQSTEQVVVLYEASDDAPGHAEVEASIRWHIKQALDITVGTVDRVEAGWITKTTSGKVARSENRDRWIAR